MAADITTQRIFWHAPEDLKRAISYAAELKAVELRQVEAITLLMGRQGDPRYPVAAARYVARLFEEIGAPGVEDLEDLRRRVEMAAAERPPL